MIECEVFLPYAAVLAAYLPGLGLIVFSKNALKFPIITFAFLGMFFFNALGVFEVLSPENIYTISFDKLTVAEDVVVILIIKAAVYYMVALPYVLIKPPPPLLSINPAKEDFLLLGCGIISMLALTLLYIFETQAILLYSLIDGSMNLENSFDFRMNAIYGLSNWPIYNIGMVFLPIAVSSYALIVFSLTNNYRWFCVAVMVFSVAISMLLGSKAGIAGSVLSFGVAYGVLVGAKGGRILDIFKFKGFIVFTFLSMTLLVIGYYKASSGEVSGAVLIERVWYRAFVVGPETIAAAISFVQENGELGLSVFPSMRGLLAHDQANLSLLIHDFVAGAPGGATLPFSAEAFISAKWGGVIAMSFFVFLMLVILQEAILRIPNGVASLAFSSLLSYLAVRMMSIGVFATFLNFMYPATILAAAILLALISHHLRRGHPVKRSI